MVSTSPAGRRAPWGRFRRRRVASALNGFMMMLAAFAIGGWVGTHLNGTIWPLVHGVWFWSVALALIAWTLVQNSGTRMSMADTLPFIALAGPRPRARPLVRWRWPPCWGGACRWRSSASIRPWSTGAWTSARPNPRGRSAPVPHHLIDIRDPLQAYSAAEFVQDATRLVGEIRARGALPLLVGGTMLYFKALFDGIDDMPAADPAVRERPGSAGVRDRLARHARRTGACRPHRRPPGAGRQPAHPACAGGVGGVGPPAVELSYYKIRSCKRKPHERWSLFFFSLEPENRAWLHERIAQRFDAMLDAGFVDEVRLLRASRRPAPRSAVDALRGLPPGLEELDLQALQPAGTP